MAVLTAQTARSTADAAIAQAPPYPQQRFRGRGIVICGGGVRYFTCAWVCIRILRQLGCALPIELWHLDRFELDPQMRQLLAPFGVSFTDASVVRQQHPVRILHGWELKPFAMLHSSFEEVLLIDADNVPTVDPEFFLETTEYKRTGAVFWPDYGRLAPTREIWAICGVPYRDEPEFETGQIVVNKRECWKALNLTMHLNEHSDFYYDFIHGDKETFHMAWRMLGQEYSMVPWPIHSLPAVMCQHDFEHRRVFQHRNMAKWDLLGRNPRVKGFLLEQECLNHLAELASVWDGRIGCQTHCDEETRELAERLIRQRHFLYVRAGHDQRPLEMLAYGKIGAGSDDCERTWCVRREADAAVLAIAGNGAETCRLRLDGDGAWRGRWLVHERMPVELYPIVAAPADAGIAEELVRQRRYRYVRVGHDEREIELLPNGVIGAGRGGCEEAWLPRAAAGGTGEVIIMGGGAQTCRLGKGPDGIWRGRWLAHEKMPVELLAPP